MVTVAVCAAAVAVCAVSCADTGFEGSEPIETFGSDEIVIAVPELSVPTVSTRVAIESDDNRTGGSLSLKWTENDAFGLWASGGENSSWHKNMEFRYHGDRKYPSGGMVYFASYSVPVMEDDTYNYTAFYPYQSDESKVDRAGNRIVYEIPSVQSGRYEGALDIMSATAEFGEALTPGFYQEIGLNFRHETHILKITVPEGSNDFGYDITRIRIEFPQPVVGELSFDTQTGEADYSGVTGSFVDVRFDTPLNEGDAFWVFVAPSTLDGEVRFTAYGGDNEKYQSEPSIAVAGQFGNLQRAGITPVKLGIKEGFSVTWFDYDVDWSNLGEPVETLHLTFANPSHHFVDGGTSMDVVRDSEDGKFKFSLRTNELQSWSGVELVPVYESAHAMVSEHAANILITDYTVDAHNDKSAKTPYLFEEDFSTVNSFSSNDEYTGGTLTGDQSAVSFLNGWSGGRIGAQAGTSIRLACRRQTSWGYAARADSAPMSALKEGASVRVSVWFDCGMNQQNGGLWSSDVSQTCYMGSVDSPQSFNSGATNGTFNDEFTIKESTGSWTSVPNTKNYKIAECTNATRLSWRTMPENMAGANNNTCWLYIDNIKVSIVNE